MLLRANPMLKKMLLRANSPGEVAPTGKPHSTGFAGRSNAVTYKRQRKYNRISSWIQYHGHEKASETSFDSSFHACLDGIYIILYKGEP